MWLYVLLAALATYRLAWMVVQEDGPFDLFTRLRSWVYRDPDKAGWLQRGFACLLCTSFWLCWIANLLVPYENWQQYVLGSLGTAGAVLFIQRMTR